MVKVSSIMIGIILLVTTVICLNLTLQNMAEYYDVTLDNETWGEVYDDAIYDIGGIADSQGETAEEVDPDASSNSDPYFKLGSAVRGIANLKVQFKAIASHFFSVINGNSMISAITMLLLGTMITFAIIGALWKYKV